MRKAFTGLGFGALFSAALAIAITTAAPTVSYADDTIKIGVLLIDSGPLASLKETQVKAANLAIEQINAAGGAAGKKLEAIFITYPGTPDTAVDGATRAVQKDGAMFITGMDTSSVSPALQLFQFCSRVCAAAWDASRTSKKYDVRSKFCFISPTFRPVRHLIVKPA